MTTLTPNTYSQCPTALIVKSLTNRKHFDPDALQALSDNIKARGIDQPIIVRALPGSRLADTFDAPPGQAKPAYEIVSGERRYRAAVMAGLVQVPVIMRVYTDLEAIEAQLVENIQRESLSEIDEAEGFEVWLQQPGITIDVVADKISKSRRYVFSRLQLLRLQPETKHALRTNQIDVSRALLLAPVHDPKLQIKALDYAATVPAGGTQPSVRDLAVWLRQNVMLDLARAPFQITAANLVPLAGSCKTCPKRTGADPDMFSHVDGADICTDPPCYNGKAAEHIANLEHQAKRQGLRLVHGAEAKAACYPNSSTLNGYSPLSQVRNDVASGAQGQRLGSLLGHSHVMPLPGAVLIENPYTRELIAAIPTAEAEAALLAKGLVKILDRLDVEADRAKGKKDVKADIAALQAATSRRVAERYEDMARAVLVKDIMATSALGAEALLSTELLRAFLKHMLSSFNCVVAFEDSGLDPNGVDSFDTTEILKAAALVITYEGAAVQQAYARENDIDLSALKHKAAAQIKAEVTAQIAALKAAQKTPTPKSPLAQPSATPPAHAELDAKPKTARPKARPKLNAEQAQLGIAEAMQGIEAPPADVAVPVLKAAHAYTKGQQVKVTTVSTDHATWRQKYEGMTGTVKALNFDCAMNMNLQSYEVAFKGRTGGVADFTADELEAA